MSPTQRVASQYRVSHRVARRFTAEMLTKEWLMGVRRGWLTLMKPAIQDYGDVFKALDKIGVFVTNLKDQVMFVRRGPYTSLPSLSEGKKFEATYKKLMEVLADARSKARHWAACYEGKNTPVGDCRADGEHMLALYQRDFESACSNYKGPKNRPREALFTEFFDDLLKLLYADAKRLKENYEAEHAGWKKMVEEEEGFDEPFEYPAQERVDSAFKEFDFGGMKVVVVDPKTNGTRIREYVKYLEMAYKDTKRKGFGALWYGTLFLMSDDYEKLSEADQAAYAKAGYKNMQSQAGTYHSGDDVVRITAPARPGLVRILIHELGHRYWYKFMSAGQRARFESVIEGDWSMVHALLLNHHALSHEEAEVFSGLYQKLERGADLSVAEKDLITKRFKELGLKAGVPLISDYSRSRPTEAFAEVFERYVAESNMTRDQLESFRSVLADDHFLENRQLGRLARAYRMGLL